MEKPSVISLSLVNMLLKATYVYFLWPLYMEPLGLPSAEPHFILGLVCFLTLFSSKNRDAWSLTRFTFSGEAGNPETLFMTHGFLVLIRNALAFGVAFLLGA